MSNSLPNSPDQDILAGDLRNPRYLGLVRSLLARGIMVRIEVTGLSMRPFLRGGERVTIAPSSPAQVRSGDLVFFLDGHDLPVLHRIVSRKNAAAGPVFVARGDGVAQRDEPFAPDRILGKAIRVEWPGRPGSIDLQSPAWRVINTLLVLIYRLRPLMSAFPLPKQQDGLLATIFRQVLPAPAGSKTPAGGLTDNGNELNPRPGNHDTET